MRRAVLASLLLVLVPALPAFAQTAGEVADQVEFRGYYVEPGVDIPIEEMESLVARHPDIGFVAVDDSPPSGADVLADEVLDLVDERDTVIVLTEDEAGAASADYSDAALQAAFDEALAGPADSYEADFAEIAAALAGVPQGSEQPESDGGGGIGLGWILVIGVVVVTGFYLWRSSRIDEKAVTRRLSDARREIEQQMAVVANQILEFSDKVEGADSPDAVRHFRQASETYEQAERRLKTAVTWKDLEELSDDLDRARWELAAATALAEGREPPPKPEEATPEPCFFDPTHGAGVEVARLETPAGPRNVMVCKADAEKLRRGERPEPRGIEIGGRSVPSPQAPRPYGGGGFDWLDAFSILVGGMGSPMGYRWGRPRYRRWGGFGVPFPGGFGGGFGGGGRSRGTAARPRAGGSRSIGRARRSR